MPKPPSRRLELVFRGRVQGVGFRAKARGVAARHAVTGWVRNEPDGSVKCVVEGPAGEPEAFRDEVLNEMSRYVKSHDEQRLEATNEFASFTVEYA